MATILNGILSTQPIFFRDDLSTKQILNRRAKWLSSGKGFSKFFLKRTKIRLGEYIRINGIYFQVVGVFAPKNSNMNFGGDKEQSIHMPFSTLQQAFNYGNIVGWFALTSKPGIDVSIVEEKAMKILKERHKVAPEDTVLSGILIFEKNSGK
jgi:hypothetical protein